MSSPLESASVKRVRAALHAAGSNSEVVALENTARTAQDAAESVGCDLGAIVKTLIFRSGDEPVMALVAGDRQCDMDALACALKLDAPCKRADADFVREKTGFAIGGVAPIADAASVRTAVDDSLSRFEVVFAAAGHPHCVFSTTLEELAALTGGIVASISRQ